MTEEKLGLASQENIELTQEEIAQFQKEHPFGCADSVGAYEKMFPDDKHSTNVALAPIAENIDKIINLRGKMGYSLMTSFPMERKIPNLLEQREVILIFSKK